MRCGRTEKVRKSHLSTEGPSPQQVVLEERISALPLVLQPLLWSDTQEATKCLRSPGQWEGRERDSHPNYNLYLK